MADNPQTQEQVRRFLQSAADYIAARYGATEAHHFISLALQQVSDNVDAKKFHKFLSYWKETNANNTNKSA